MESASEETPLLSVFPGHLLQRPSRSSHILSSRNSGRSKALFRSWGRLNRGENRHEDVEDVLREIERDELFNGQMLALAILAILLHLASGVVVMRWLEGWTFYNSAYFCVVTTTTVGYGDITPKREVSKLFVIYYSLASIGIISFLLAYALGALVDRQEESVLHALGEDECFNWAETQGLLGTLEKDELLLSFVLVLVLIAIGVLTFVKLENLSLVNALYVTVISTSTVGFGDYEPTRKETKWIMTVWLCFSTVCVAKFIGDIAHTFAKMKQRAATRRLMGATLDMRSLRYLDRNHNRRVDKVQFLVEMLTRTGRVSEQDLNQLMAMFDELDGNHDGYITPGDCQTDAATSSSSTASKIA
ncbi:hypothetical protein FGB62_47g167 [Gracilaria domingensis]|nr:hypothetical protein FGB62_47g167 [Gracilaria domingensis]